MHLLFKLITAIIRTLWRLLSFSRVLITNLIFIMLLAIFAFSWFGHEGKTLPDRAALLIQPTGTITETAPPNNPWQQLLQQELEEIQNSPLQDLLDVIEAAASDPRIKLLVLDSSRMEQISLTQIMTLGEALEQFKKSGKKVIAIGDHFSQSHYLLASHAHEIILNPIGGVELKGFSRYRLYGRQALDKLKVNFNLFRAGDYKSALEPFFRNNMSDAARSANQDWLSDIWQSGIHRLLAGRPQLNQNTLNDYIDNYAHWLSRNNGNAANAALSAGLVDRLFSRPQARRYIADQVGTATDDKHDFAQINWRDYSQQIKKSYQHPPTFAKIAVIVASGNIMPGRQPDSRIGAETLSLLLRKARNNPEIKAVVLRIDSGGGSMTASEIIRQEVLQLQESGKPVVISMGRLAASGAYWISADADEIWAETTTLTGSIGVFGAWPTFEQSLAEIGIHSDGVSTNPKAGKLSLTRSLQPQQARALQLNVNQGYRRFLEIVAGGRRLSLAEVEKLAGGRVFSGYRAKELGLVDHLGSLRDAVNSTAARVGLTADDAVYLQSEKSATDIIGDLLNGRQNTFTSLLVHLLPKSYSNLAATLQGRQESFFNLTDPQNLYVYSLLDSFIE
ncbi:signal peptide peptidase SppA [bacterium]|nr:signal peptide peptidase SppA [bacterium]